MVSKNKVKHLASLKNKKFRQLNRQFMMEGDKIVTDSLRGRNSVIREIIALPEWISVHQPALSGFKGEVHETDSITLGKLTSLETVPPVLAVLDYFEYNINENEILSTVSLALDTIQDPGNLGTIIRTADWFGVKNIFCSPGCADIYNPKVIQASMGAILNVRIHYVDLVGYLGKLNGIDGFEIRGTYMQGSPLWNMQTIRKGMVIFGNESKGISDGVTQYIHQRINIPAASDLSEHVESLNVATSVAVVLAFNTSKPMEL